MTKTHEPQNAKVAVKEAGLVRKHPPCRIASKDYICERRKPVPEVSDCIDVVQVFTDMRSVLPKLLLSHCSFDGSILQILVGGGGGGEICCQGGGRGVRSSGSWASCLAHARAHTLATRAVGDLFDEVLARVCLGGNEGEDKKEEKVGHKVE